MYIPRGRLLALIAFVVAASMVTATGAFTSVEAERTAEINVAGDAKAFLSLTPSEGPNGAYAQQTDGKITIVLNSDADTNGGEGINPDATTRIDNVITVTNQGTQEVTLSVSDEHDNMDIYLTKDGQMTGSQKIGTGDTANIGILVDATDKTTMGDKTFTIVAMKEGSAGSSQNGGNSEGESE